MTEEICLPCLCLVTDFDVDRIIKLGEYQAWHFVHSAGKCGEETAGACHAHTHSRLDSPQSPGNL